MRKYLIIGLLIFGGCTPPPDPCDNYTGPNPNVIATWDASPTPVAFYILELATNGKTYIEIATTEAEFYRFDGEIEFCNTYKCRVIAVGEDGQKSDPSEPSLRYDPIPQEKP